MFKWYLHICITAILGTYGPLNGGLLKWMLLWKRGIFWFQSCPLPQQGRSCPTGVYPFYSLNFRCEMQWSSFRGGLESAQDTARRLGHLLFILTKDVPESSALISKFELNFCYMNIKYKSKTFFLKFMHYSLLKGTQFFLPSVPGV